MASTSKPHLIKSLCLVGTIAVWGTTASLATAQPSDVPAWLRSHIGEGGGQIAQVVLQRARALYLKKVAAGVVKNPCYFAMDATRPNGGRLGKAVLHDLRSRPVVSRGRHGSWQRSQGQGCPELHERKRMREEFWQCAGILSDDRRRLRDGRDENLVQGLLSQLSETGCRPDALVRSVRRRGRDRQCQGA